MDLKFLSVLARVLPESRLPRLVLGMQSFQSTLKTRENSSMTYCMQFLCNLACNFGAILHAILVQSCVQFRCNLACNVGAILHTIFGAIGTVTVVRARPPRVAPSTWDSGSQPPHMPSSQPSVATIGSPRSC